MLCVHCVAVHQRCGKRTLAVTHTRAHAHARVTSMLHVCVLWVGVWRAMWCEHYQCCKHTAVGLPVAARVDCSKAKAGALPAGCWLPWGGIMMQGVGQRVQLAHTCLQRNRKRPRAGSQLTFSESLDGQLAQLMSGVQPSPPCAV
jgi:hypothetical protein